MRVTHLTDKEIQAYLDAFEGHGRVSPGSLESGVQDHLDFCLKCQAAVRSYAHLFSELACQKQPSLSRKFAYKVASMIPRRPVPPVVVVPVTLGWAYLVMVLLTWWLTSVNWVGTGLSLADRIVKFRVVANAVLTGLGQIPGWSSVVAYVRETTVAAVDIVGRVLTSTQSTPWTLIAAAVVILLVAAADSLTPAVFERQRRV